MLREIAAVASAVLLALSAGFTIGMVWGYKGPLIYGEMSNSTVNASLDRASGYPCFDDDQVRYVCVFRDAGGEWDCQGWWLNMSYGHCQRLEKAVV